MSIQIFDRVQETTNTSGTGSVILNGAVSGFLSFAATVGVSNQTYYGIVDDIAKIWEIGIGTLTGTNVLRRDSVLSSSNNNELVSFVGNSCRVFIDVPAQKRVQVDSSPSTYTLTNSNNADTLGTNYNVYFVHLSYGQYPTVNLPDPSLMVGQTITFVGSFTNSESDLNIHGNIQNGDSNYTLTVGQIARMISDGSTWWTY